EMARDVDAEPIEQRGEASVQVVAVPATAGEDPADAGERIDPGRLAAHDVDVLVRNRREVRALQLRQLGCIHVAGPGVDAKLVRVRGGGSVVDLARDGARRGTAPWHFLNFLPEPHQQGSFLPTFRWSFTTCRCSGGSASAVAAPSMAPSAIPAAAIAS